MYCIKEYTSHLNNMIRSRGAKRNVTSLFIQNCCFPRSILGLFYNDNSAMLFVDINIIFTIHSEFGALPNSDLNVINTAWI